MKEVRWLIRREPAATVDLPFQKAPMAARLH